jgi:chemotaxis family two-component system response regulator Rcp1
MPKPTGSPARILVIEDNQADVFLLRHALDEQGEEYQLEVLRDGGEAILFVQNQRMLPSDPNPCAIVLDLHLPKHDGAAVLKAIRDEPTLAHIHVVALTSFASPTEEKEVRELGIRLYRAKPTDLDEWIQLAGDILAICNDGAEVLV